MGKSEMVWICTTRTKKAPISTQVYARGLVRGAEDQYNMNRHCEKEFETACNGTGWGH